MNVAPTSLPGVLVLEPKVFRDDRGYFLETWNAARYAEAGLPARFVQDNLSSSRRGVLRGLHFQHPAAQGKLVQALRGAIFDVAVDIRRGSPTFGRWVGVELSEADGRQLYVPGGFAHGFVVIGDAALVAYKCTAPYRPRDQGAIRWDDPDLAIAWPVADPLLAPKDRDAPALRDLPPARLPAVRAARSGRCVRRGLNEPDGLDPGAGRPE